MSESVSERHKDSRQISFEQVREELNPLKKKLKFLAWLNSELLKRGKNTFPVLVGGSAVQYYTNGAYASLDMDILWSDSAVLTEILSPYGFKREGRYWFNDEEDLVLEAPSHFFNEKYITLNTGYGSVRMIALEELIMDRLDAYKWTNRRDDYKWAKVMLETYLCMRNELSALDYEYLAKETKNRDIADALENLLNDVKGNEVNGNKVQGQNNGNNFGSDNGNYDDPADFGQEK